MASKTQNRQLGYLALAILVVGMIFFVSPGGQFSITGDDCVVEEVPSPDGNGFQTYTEYRRAAGVDASDEEIAETLTFIDGTLHHEVCGGSIVAE